MIARAEADRSDVPWAGTIPTGRRMWTCVNPGNVGAANWKPMLLTSPAEFRPAPPPDCDSAEVRAQLAEVRNYPRAAFAYASIGAAAYDAFIASQDGKFTYWYLRPAQLDPSITPLFNAPNVPAYPSNRSTLSTPRS